MIIKQSNRGGRRPAGSEVSLFVSAEVYGVFLNFAISLGSMGVRELGGSLRPTLDDKESR